jgi:superfamily II DNA or RNA helicase
LLTDVTITKENESYMIVHPKDDGIKQNLHEMFTFYAPNFRWHPLFKKGLWDGKIKLYNKETELLYLNFYKKLIEKLKTANITYEEDTKVKEINKGISQEKTEEFLKNLKSEFKPYEHQIDMIKAALLKKRLVAVSPTASGKSFAYYLYIKYLIENVLRPEQKVLLVVPTISLVLQMKSDFVEYDKYYKNIEEKIHIIMSGCEKDSDKQIYISTWQSIYDLKTDYFNKFSVLIIDEVHGAKAASLTGICEKCINAEWRLGATGTLDEWKTHHMVIEGLLGEIFRITKTKTLIEKKILSPLKIFSFIFKYPIKEAEYLCAIEKAQPNKRKAYQEEIKFVYNHPKRNLAVCRLTKSLSQNTLVLFSRIEHGQYLYKKITEMTKGVNKVFYVAGANPAQEREDIRAQFERDSNCICIASDKVFSVGINIKNLHNVVIASGGKSKIKILQSIGRGLRLHESKVRLNVIDIVDDLRCTYINEEGDIKKFKNFMFQHYSVRLRYYKDEDFENKERIVKMED